LFSFAIFQLSSYKILLGISNIGGTIAIFYPKLSLCVGVNAPFSSNREEEVEDEEEVSNC
jgi:hypothetical protein